MRSLQLLVFIAVGMMVWGKAAPASGSVIGSNTIVRIEVDRGTNRLGIVDVELFGHDKPETVRNFLLYTRSGAFSNTFLHRCVPGFVVQGGGFADTNPLSATTFSSYLEVTYHGRLTNEFAVGPRLTNNFGTIAMAKVGNDPNSATSQWFFNLGDNAANLDNQNGGFTVFGRVLGTTNSSDGTNVLQHFNTLAPSAGVVNITAFPVFNEIPVSYTNSTRTPAYRELYHTRVYVLGETNTPGASAPTIVLTNPAPNVRFTNQSVVVSGTAADDRAVARVIYRHQGGAIEVAAGTNSWQAGITPRPGFNTVSVESVDWDGNHSTNVTVSFYYVSRLPLNLRITGQGTVNGVTNGQPLQVGNVYVATAKAAKGYFFEGWTGAVASAGSPLTFQVATNATNFNLTARFTRDFFPALAGTYQGLFRETNTSTLPGLENTGFLRISLNSKGGYSGRIRHRSGTYSFTGRFDRNGSSFLQGTVGGVSRTFTLRLDTTNTFGVIVGSVSGSSSSSIEAALDRVAPSLPTNALPVGDYPFSIAPPAVTPGPLIPGGHGYGRATVQRNGTVQLRGTLGDGSAFTATAKASRSGRWPFYLNMSKGQGAVQGWLTASTNQIQTMESRLTWMRGFDLNATTYRAGFSNHVVLTGMRLQVPQIGRRYLNWVTGQARLDGANLVLGVTNTVRLNPDNTITIPEPNPTVVRLNVDLASGLVNGTFVHPWIGTTNALHGVLFKPGESIRGQFIDGDQTGSLLVNIAPFLSTQMVANVTFDGFNAALAEGGLIRFENDGDIVLTNTITPPYNTALDANGHVVRILGGGLTSLFVVPTNQTFSAVGIVLGDGRQTGTNGASSATPQPGGDACGAGVLNLGGVVGFTNCVFTNFIVLGGNAGTDTGTNGLLPAGGRAWGAALCNRRGSVALLNCSFVDNLAAAGTGTSPGPGPSFTNRLYELPGAALGGAIYSDGPELLILGTSFGRNEARGGAAQSLPDGSATRGGYVAGGAVAALTGTLRISSNSFLTNFATAASIPTNAIGAGLAHGGALFVESNVTAVIERSTFTANAATGGHAWQTTTPGDALGGGVFSAGYVQLTDTTLDHNLAQAGAGSPPGTARGGGIAALGFLNVTNSTLHHNLANGGLWTGVGAVGTPGGLAWGGGLYVVRSNLNVLNSTFAYNRALSATETNGTLPGGNPPGDRLGGAIAAVSNSTALSSVTLAFNEAGSAGMGGTNQGLAGGGAVVNLGGSIALRTSLLVSNAPANYRGSLTDVGYNFSSDASIPLAPSTGINHTNINVQLGPLMDNGGPTLTMSLKVGSPARDKIPPGNLPVLFDQRGIDRPQPAGGSGDAGAVEAQLTNAAPIFIIHPQAPSFVRVGTNVTLQGAAVATASIFYYWTKDNQPISGATNATLTLFSIQVTNNGNYALVATNSFGSATSTVATIVVDATPLITTQPASISVSPTVNTSFFVGASPVTGLSYFWYHENVRVGPNAATLPITNASPADRGNYFVVVSNSFGVATSQVATLTFNALALQIVTQPANLTVAEGRTTNFSVAATSFGGAPISYQWLFGGVPLPGQTSTNLVLTNVTSANVGSYQAIVTNAYLSLTSVVATLTLDAAAVPTFTLHPAGATVRAGSNYVFQVAAAGTSPLTYSWLFNGSPLSASAGSTLTVTNAQATNAGSYRAVVTNTFGMSTSQVAVLVVDSKPRILVEPIDVVVSPGATTNFLVGADGPDLVYAWTRDGQVLAWATNDTLQVTNAGPTDRGAYQVILTNAFGSATSRVAVLTFDTNALAILSQPTNTMVTTGQVASFSVAVGGVPPFAYQWTFGGANLLDATNSLLSIPGADLTNAGSYRVIVTNAYNSVTSVIANLTVDTNALGPASVPQGPTLSVRLEGGELWIECSGRPGDTYRLLQSESIDRPEAGDRKWIALEPRTIPASGRARWILPRPADRQLFYRAISP